MHRLTGLSGCNGPSSAPIVEDSYQAFNESKFMTVIDSYRDTDGAKDLITRSVAQYRDVYKAMGLEVK